MRISNALDQCFHDFSTHDGETFTLTRGQQLFRGVSASQSFIQALCASTDNEFHRLDSFVSTSLSECVATAYAYYSRIMVPIQDNEPCIPLLFRLNNRVKSLPFILTDGVKKDLRYNKGQMEILLPRTLQVRTTHFDYQDQLAIMDLDIVGYDPIFQGVNHDQNT